MIEFLVLIFVKHYLVDFVWQTDAMVKGKAIYGNRDGILHSAQHALGTFVVCALTVVDPVYWLILAAIDFVTHYHIDWIKMNYGNRDITNPKFWNHLGLDQLAHQLTYLLMVMI